MNWITNFVKPKLKALIRRSDIPEDLWIKCPSCQHMLFHRVLEEQGNVCQYCDHHLYLPIIKRLDMLLDRSYQMVSLPEVVIDPLKFKDVKKYTDRLKQYTASTKRNEAAAIAVGTIQNHPCVVFAMDFQFMGGSMGVCVGEAFKKAAMIAVNNNKALIAITASGGARMQESVLSLMQMPKTVVAIEMLKEKRLPYITVLTSPTMGGVTASFAMLGDIALAEPKALIGFTGPRVIEQTLRQKLPEGFQLAEYLLKHGMIDAIVHRKDLTAKLGKILGMLKV